MSTAPPSVSLSDEGDRENSTIRSDASRSAISESQAPTIISTSTKLVERVLTGQSTYTLWKKNVFKNLHGQRLSHHLTQPSPSENDSTYDDWYTIDCHIYSQLLNSTDISVQNMVSNADTAKEIWDTLADMYSSLNDFCRLYDVVRGLLKPAQSGRPLQEYYEGFKSFADEFVGLVPFTTNRATFLEQRTQFLVTCYLNGLGTEFETARSQILSDDHIPTLGEVHRRVLRSTSRDESRSVVSDSIEHTALYSGHGVGRGGSRGRGIGGRGRGRDTRICHYCGIQGHIQPYCRKFQAAQVAQGSRTTPAHVATEASVTRGESKLVTMSPDEYARYLEYQTSGGEAFTASIAQLPSTSACAAAPNTAWVIDSSAGSHMTGNRCILADYQSLSNFDHIIVANGSTLTVQGHGVVHPSKAITLSTVLFTPGMAFNLLSVSRITQELHCSVTFYPDCCVLQDLSTQRTICRGRVNGGLYYLESMPVPAAVVKESDVLDVHCRLGHPSLSMLQSLFPRFKSVSRINCESCQLAKHCRVSLSPSVSQQASAPFSLVHSDIWGPCPVTSTHGFRYFVLFVDDYSRMSFIYLIKTF